MQKIKELFIKYKEIILYVIFGGLTTVVDWAVSFALYHLWDVPMQSMPWLIHVADAIAWIAAVLFAFFTNRMWVFESKRHGFWSVMGELAGFAGGRIVTLLLQEALIAVFFTWLGLNKYLVKIGVAVLVVIGNYFISKFLVFRKKKQPDTTDKE